ncbi:hypothetical protein AGLY_008895 [Aphis glycines]|uniref:Uncharacterized protein n=1 Tax=Aphis glycines TaxID=307491 RepID=A0A6G0TJW4_APHGL|nr:hypothetical protein AGLY_008895 [Aphis glycines]
MAFKMKENYQKTASIALNPISSSSVNVYINRVGRAVTLTIAPISQKNNQEKLYKKIENIQNIQEAKILNEINIKHCDTIYGKDTFYAGKHYIVGLEVVHEYYKFIEICYKKLQCNITPGRKEIYGFIRVNSESVVPFCLKDGHKYVPLFYFEGETENLRHRVVKLENWNLAHLKF